MIARARGLGWWPARSAALAGGIVSVVLGAGCSSGDVPALAVCRSNAECPEGQYCGPDGRCTFDCRRDEDCAPGRCSSLGKCVDETPRDAGATPPDALAAPDTGIVDGPPADRRPPPPRDMALLDVPLPKDSAIPDASPADVGVDAPPPDAPAPDLPIVDAAPPDLPGDQGLDAPPDLAPDTVPPWNVDDCAQPVPLTLVGGLASASGNTTGASNGLSLAADGCTGYTSPGPDHFYTVNLVGGKLYEVTLTPAAGFDPTLYVATSCDASTCEPGMGTDRLGDGVVERVLLAPELSRAYLIVVDAFDAAEAGSYTLTVKEFAPPSANDGCAAAEQLSFSLGLASAVGNTWGATNGVTLPETGCTAWSSPGPDLFYAVYLEADQRYGILLRPAADFDPALAVFTSCADVAGSCQPGMGSDRFGSGVAEWIELRPTAAGIHYILVDSYDAAERGSFSLTVAELSGAPTNDTCAQAEQLTLSGGRARAVGDTRSGTNQVTLSAAGCTGYATAGNDLFYSFNASAGEVYRVTLEPAATFDGALYVFSSCSDPEGTCGSGLGSDSGGAGAAEQVDLQIISGGQVRVAVDSYTGTVAGTFALTVQQLAVQTCGPANCSGCCANNACYVGTEDAACGTGGGQCASCGTGLTCSAGQCAVDDEAYFRIVLVSGTVPATRPDGSGWDPAGSFVLPDPYVRLAVGGQSQSSSNVSDTATPVWNQALLDAKAGEIKAGLSLEVWDADFIGDDLITSCAPTVSAAELLAGSKTVSCGTATLELQFFVR